MTKIPPSGLDNTQDFSTLSTEIYTKANTAYDLVTSALKVTSIVYPSNDSAADTGGGQTITLNGTGFAAGVTVVVGTTPAATVTFIGSTLITFITPTLAAGTYVIYVVNSDGTTTLSVPGIIYSSTPVWTTASGSVLSAIRNTASLSITLVATGDAPITYSLYSGTLPSGLTLNSSTGVISGTSPNVGTSTTYSFAIRATDAQGQDSDRNFSISITVDPIVVVFGMPAGGGGADQTWTVPADVASVQFKLWGAGGGGAGATEFGGAGGYASGFRNVTPGETFTLRVGGGGYGSVEGTGAGNDVGGFGGGTGGGQDHGGGGGTYIFSGGTAFANVIAAAGGGGGGSIQGGGGHGGGTTGTAGHGPGGVGTGGQGGTQTAGGVSTPGGEGTATYGGQLTGGTVTYGGGAGGGYYGGGAGRRNGSWGHSAGGGGSGYVGGLTGVTSLLAGTGVSLPGNAADTDRASATVNSSSRSAGQGGNTGSSWGGGGRIVIRY